MKSESHGFTLMELMITVAIIAILGAVIYPSYMSQIRRSNRSAAKSALLQVQVAQEKAFLTYNRYAKDDTELQGTPTSTTPGLQTSTTISGGNYTMSLSSASSGASDFTITATASSASQLKDTDCKTFSISNLGTKSATNSGGTSNLNCWIR